MNPKVNILFLCNKSPWPAREGGPIAMNNIIEGLIDAGHRVKVLALNTNKYAIKPKDIPAAYREKTGIELVYVDLSIKPIEAFINLFSTRSYHVERFKSEAFEKKLISVLEENEFDIVQIELLFMSPYIHTIRQYTKAKIVLRAHNIEHLIWERLTASERNPLKKLYLKHLAHNLKHYEHNILSAYDGIVPITKKDAVFFETHSQVPVQPVSFGINTAKLNSSPGQLPEHALFHIGAMNWLPNAEGIRWFIDRVWPMVHHALPNLKLYLAGREMPGWLLNLDRENVVVLGEVDDASEFIQSKTISIAPLLSGSGIRIKIIESMALGRAVISTSIGAEGINYTHGQDMLIADTPRAFLEAIKLLYSNPAKTREMGENARQLVLRMHDSEKIISRLVQFYRRIL